MAGFIRKILESLDSPFVQDIDNFVRAIADAGFVNSLAQTLLKVCTPGMPDFYQGVELWDFNLVDPDNRRPVDFTKRAQALARLQVRAKEDLSQLASELMDAWPEERLKLFVTWRALTFRRDNPSVIQGDYRSLAAAGPREAHVCAFVRSAQEQWMMCLVPRLALGAWQRRQAVVTPDRTGGSRWSVAPWWRDTVVPLPAGTPARWRHVLTGDVIESVAHVAGGRALDVEGVFRHFPIALLHADDA